jgi:hypothetical protein
VLFAVLNVDAVGGSRLPHGGLFPQAFDSFLFSTQKPVDTCFYARTTSGIFNLAKVAFFILRKYHLISILYYLEYFET